MSLRGLAVAAVFAVVAVSGCSGSDEPAKDPTPPAPEETEETEETEPTGPEADVLEVYQQYWDIQVAMFSEPTVHSEDLGDYAQGKALEDVRETAFYLVTHNTRMTGEPVLHPEITDLDMDATPAVARIEDCVDSQDYVQVDEDGEPVETEDKRWHRVESTLERQDGSWIVTESVIDREASCR